MELSLKTHLEVDRSPGQVWEVSNVCQWVWQCEENIFSSKIFDLVLTALHHETWLTWWHRIGGTWSKYLTITVHCTSLIRACSGPQKLAAGGCCKQECCRTAAVYPRQVVITVTRHQTGGVLTSGPVASSHPPDDCSQHSTTAHTARPGFRLQSVSKLCMQQYMLRQSNELDN